MSRPNVDLVRRFEEGWARQDLDAVLDCVHPDMEFDWSDSRGPFRGTYTGHDGLTRFWNEMLDAWEYFRPEMVEAVDCGDEELITVDVVHTKGKGSGIEMEAQGAMLWSVRAGKIVRAKMYQTKDEALAATGRSGQHATDRA